MDFVKQWTLTVCVTLIISVIFSILTPKGNMGRFFKVILAMFIFVSFIYPIKAANFDFEIPELNLVEYEDEQESAYKNIIISEIKESLKSGGFNSAAVDADISVNDGEITINSLEVGVPTDSDCNDVKSYLLENTGFNAEVYHIGE